MPTIVEQSGNPDIDGVLWGWRWSGTNLTYSFPTGTATYTDNGYTAVNGFQAFTADQQAAMERILRNYDAVCEITLTRGTNNTVTSLRFAEATSVDDGQTGLDTKETATGTPPDPTRFPDYSHGDAWFSPTNYDQTPDIGTYTYTSGLMHEVGHALGLKHGHATQIVDHQGHTHTYPELPFNHDSQEYSIMTYNDYVGDTTPSIGSRDLPTSLMLSDIAALQHMYGADYGTNDGNTVYSWSTTTGEMSIDGVEDGQPWRNFIFQTIWDGGGIDTYDFSNYRTNLRVNLNPGEWTTVDTGGSTQLAELEVGRARGNIANAWLYRDNLASIIENASGGSGNDEITGNRVANTLDGGAGTDTLDGGAGSDTVDYRGRTSAIAISLTDSAAIWAKVGGVNEDLLQNIENVWGGTSADILSGNSFDNYLSGENGNDALKGGGGRDAINGGIGVDTADYRDKTSPVVLSLDPATLTDGWASAKVNGVHEDWVLGVENIRGGSGADRFTGNGVANQLYGNGGADVLAGGGSNDFLVGGLAKDTLTGGLNADIFDFNQGEVGLGTTTRDIILDFNRSQVDKFDLQGIDANAGVSGDQAFNFRGTQAFTGAGQLRANDLGSTVILQGSTDADSAPEFEIEVRNFTGTCVATDFIL